MNKVYSVIWNTTLNQLVVTSELASLSGGGSGTRGGAGACSVAVSSAEKNSLTTALLPLLLTMTGSLALLAPTSAMAGTCLQMEAQGAESAGEDGATILATCANGSIAIGAGGGATADDFGVAIGDNAVSTGENSIAVGRQSGTVDGGATALGLGLLANAAGATAFGNAASASVANSIAIGTLANASDESAIAIGNSAVADSADAVAIGTNATATGGRAVSIGLGNVARGNGAVAIGDPNTATGDGAVAQGMDNTATGDGTVAMGHTNMVGGGGQGVSTPGTAAQGAVGIGFQNTATGQGAVAIGNSNTAAGRGAIAIGSTSTTATDGDIAMGAGATADGTNAPGAGSATAIGNGAQAGVSGATALGHGARADGQYATALGTGAIASGISTAVGPSAKATGQGGAALGANSNAGSFAVAAGWAASAVDGAVAIGVNSTAGDWNAVALGSGSVTAAAVGTTSTTINGTTYNFAGNAPGTTVSIGAVGAERTITNLAAGRVNATSTDAINGSQLFAAHQAIEQAAAGWGIAVGASTGSIASGETLTFAAGTNATAVYDDATKTLTVGVTADPSFNTVTIGNTLLTTNGLAITGGPSITNTGISAGGLTITNVAGGVNATDAVNVAQLNQVVAGSATHYYSVNDGGAQQGNYNNSGATAAGAIAVGAGAGASAVDAVAMGTGANATTANSVALGAGSTTAAAVGTTGTTIAGDSYTFAGGAPVGTASVGSAGAERTITNVAAGRIANNSTDAVNGSQLHATNQAVEGLDTRVTSIENSIGNIGNINTTINNFDNRITNVENNVADVQNGADGAFQVSQEGTMAKPLAIGANSTAGGNGAVASGSNALAVGNQSQASAAGSTALGTGAAARHANSVALGAGSTTTRGAQTGYEAAYVGSSTSTGEMNVGGRTITGVAPGIAGTDVVNVDQLKGGVNYAIDQSKAYTDSRLQKFDNDMWALDRSYRGGTASAMAMAGLPQAYLPGKSMLAVSVGGYQSEYGMAVGLSGVTSSGRVVYKAQASGNTVRDWGFSVGAGIQW